MIDSYGNIILAYSYVFHIFVWQAGREGLIYLKANNVMDHCLMMAYWANSRHTLFNPGY